MTRKDKDMKDLTEKSNKAIKTYFNMNAGTYCGLLLEKRLAIRMGKLLYKQQQEIKELLASNIEETEVAEWALAYPDNKQTTVNFFNPKATIADKMYRVDLFTKNEMIKKLDEVFMSKDMREAEHNYLEYYDKLEFKRKK
jgi:hypothetical protein